MKGHIGKMTAHSKTDPKRAARIKSIRKDLLGMKSQSEFADWIGGVTRGAVGNWELGQHIGLDKMSMIARKAGVSLEWLAYGSGEMRPLSPSTVLEAGTITGHPVRFAGKVQAGAFVEVDMLDQSYDSEDQPITPLPDPRYAKAKQYAWLVVGDSMNKDNILDGMYVLGADFHDYTELYSDDLKDGSLVIVERSRNGGHEVERTVKRIRLFVGRYELHPHSTNPKHKPIKVTPNNLSDTGEEVRILAVVLSSHTIY
jgi:SOS-response transcriptional repressor LexA